MSQVIKVSKQGKDVLSGTLTPNDYIFDSTLNTFKIVSSGTISGTVSGDPSTLQLAHNQGTIPAVYAFAKFPDGYVSMPGGLSRTGDANRWWKVEMDATNVYFDFYKGTTANYNPVVSYYIFEAPL